MQNLYLERPNLYIGFYGCEKANGINLVNNPKQVKISTTNHEWLGKGFYVWENNQERAWDWARNHKPRPFKDPFVIGVVYTLGNCLDLTDSHFIDLLSEGFKSFEADIEGELLENKNGLHKLDCAVIEYLHKSFEDAEDSIVYDSVRGAFYEGDVAYKGTEIRKKNHIQVCLRNMNCIKGFFLPRC